MKFHYMGKFDGNIESLPKREHEPNAVMFKEPDNMERFAVITTIASLVVLLVLSFISFIISGEVVFNWWGWLLFMLCLAVHEFLHAICFKDDVYMYTNLSQGNLFVLGPEAMTKFRFCFMSMLPCIILGIIPYVCFLVNNEFITLGTLGILSLSSCVGDWLNVFNAITQMPKGAKTYISGMNSYWYIPESKKEENEE